MPHVGDELRGYREAKKLSRGPVAEATGLTVAKIHRIENTGNVNPDEEQLLRDYYDAPEIDIIHSVTGVSGEDSWCGLRKDDMCKVKGQLRATFKFIRYVQPDGKPAYVEVVGGKSGHHMLRTFSPDRILNLKGKPVMT